MNAVANKSSMQGRWLPKLAELFPMFRSPGLEQELAEAKTRIIWQKKRTERLQQRYDAMDRQCAALNNNVSGLRSRLYTAEQRAEAFGEVIRIFCALAQTAEELKRIYTSISPVLDDSGFVLFHAAQDITGCRLAEEFPYEDACGCFEFMDGYEQLRYLTAFEFGAVDWESVPGTDCKKAILREVDESTPAYREFERQLYIRALDRLELWERGQQV